MRANWAGLGNVPPKDRSTPSQTTTVSDWRSARRAHAAGRALDGGASRGPEGPYKITGPGSWYASAMGYQDRITIEPGKRGGKPCIRGLRITVYDVLEYLASGMSEDQILRDFPDLAREDIRACLAFAADRERKLVSVPPQ